MAAAPARDAGSHQVQTVYAGIQIPTRTRFSLSVRSLHTLHIARSSEIICDSERSLFIARTKTRTLDPHGFYFGIVRSLELTLSASACPWVMHANIIIYKLACAYVCIEFNWTIIPLLPNEAMRWLHTLFFRLSRTMTTICPYSIECDWTSEMCFNGCHSISKFIWIWCIIQACSLYNKLLLILSWSRQILRPVLLRIPKSTKIFKVL